MRHVEGNVVSVPKGGHCAFISTRWPMSSNMTRSKHYVNDTR
nr:MAG TPA: hypothetical protein [Bacteriophage sp.]